MHENCAKGQMIYTFPPSERAFVERRKMDKKVIISRPEYTVPLKHF